MIGYKNYRTNRNRGQLSDLPFTEIKTQCQLAIGNKNAMPVGNTISCNGKITFESRSGGLNNNLTIAHNGSKRKS